MMTHSELAPVPTASLRAWAEEVRQIRELSRMLYVLLDEVGESEAQQINTIASRLHGMMDTYLPGPTNSVLIMHMHPSEREWFGDLVRTGIERGHFPPTARCDFVRREVHIGGGRVRSFDEWQAHRNCNYYPEAAIYAEFELRI